MFYLHFFVILDSTSKLLGNYKIACLKSWHKRKRDNHLKDNWHKRISRQSIWQKENFIKKLQRWILLGEYSFTLLKLTHFSSRLMFLSNSITLLSFYLCLHALQIRSHLLFIGMRSLEPKQNDLFRLFLDTTNFLDISWLIIFKRIFFGS